MSRTNELPFERGATAFDGDTTLISNALGTDYTVQEVDDTDPTTGEEIEMIALRNNKGGVIYPGFGYKPEAGYMNKQVDGFPAAGGFGYILDPYYRSVGVYSVANNDVAWFIKRGRCDGGKTGANWTDGNNLAFAANGVLSPISGTTAGLHAIAKANETKTHTSAATSGEYALCYVGDVGAYDFLATESVSQ